MNGTNVDIQEKAVRQFFKTKDVHLYSKMCFRMGHGLHMILIQSYALIMVG